MNSPQAIFGKRWAATNTYVSHRVVTPSFIFPKEIEMLWTCFTDGYGMVLVGPTA